MSLRLLAESAQGVNPDPILVKYQACRGIVDLLERDEIIKSVRLVQRVVSLYA